MVIEDTGGGLHGNHIDLYMESKQAAIEAGVQTATVYQVHGGN